MKHCVSGLETEIAKICEILKSFNFLGHVADEGRTVFGRCQGDHVTATFQFGIGAAGFVGQGFAVGGGVENVVRRAEKDADGQLQFIFAAQNLIHAGAALGEILSVCDKAGRAPCEVAAAAFDKVGCDGFGGEDLGQDLLFHQEAKRARQRVADDRDQPGLRDIDALERVGDLVDIGSCGTDQRQTAHVIGVVQGQRFGNGTAQRMADDQRFAQTFGFDKFSDHARLFRKGGLVGAVAFGPAAAGPVDGDHAEITGQFAVQGIGEVVHVAAQAVDQDQGFAGAFVQPVDLAACDLGHLASSWAVGGSGCAHELGYDRHQNDQHDKNQQNDRDCGHCVFSLGFGGTVPVLARGRKGRVDFALSVQSMDQHMPKEAAIPMTEEAVDLLIIGAGLSGIGQACHMTRTCADKSFVVVEAREAIGGTWDLFRYPGIRSDSDMFTFGYRFYPWKSARDVAPGPDILAYLNETIDTFGVRDRIRLNSRITSLDWSSVRKRWCATVQTADAAPYQIEAKFVSSCTGYYRYDSGYLPDWPGYDSFAGKIAHPQSWPEDLDYAGKRVAVIGSGATAVTIVPSMAQKAAHVTMIQRSPTFILSRPGKDAFAEWANRLLPWRAAWKLARVKNILLSMYIWRNAKTKPQDMRAFLRKMAVDALPEGFDVDTHFNPSFDPWDQRLCLIPDGDFYQAISSGRASVVTDHIDHFTADGIVMQGGETIEADIVVPATGLQIQFLGGIAASVDGVPIEPTKHMVYRGMMLSNVPNFVVVFGYSNASWTLKADLSADFMCRMINRAAQRGQDVVTPVLDGPADGDRPLVSLQSGYLERAQGMLPKTSDQRPWMNYENYIADMMSIRHGKMEDGVLTFS